MKGDAASHSHAQHRKRMRKRVMEEGLGAFQPHEVLELLLFYGIPRGDVNELGHRLIDHFGSLANVLDASVQELMAVEGVGENTAVLLSTLPEVFSLYNKSRWGERPTLSNAMRAGAYCVNLFANQRIESMAVVCLDTQKKLLHARLLFRGTIDETPIYIRDIVEYALQQKAHSVIISHNHPSGVLRPSAQDRERTEEIRVALSTLGIAVEDHIIVAGDSFLSLRQEKSYLVHPKTQMVFPRAAESPDPSVKK